MQFTVIALSPHLLRHLIPMNRQQNHNSPLHLGTLLGVLIAISCDFHLRPAIITNNLRCSLNGIYCRSHLIPPIVGAKVANDHNQVPYHSLHFLVVALSHFWAAVVEQDSDDIEKLERQSLFAKNLLEKRRKYGN
jgi:hypothetical protein